MKVIVRAYLETSTNNYSLVATIDDKLYIFRAGESDLGRALPEYYLASAVSKHEFTPLEPPMTVEVRDLTELGKRFGPMVTGRR